MGGFAVLWVAWGTLSLPDLIEICVVAGALLVSVAVGLVASRWVRNIPVQGGEQPPNWKIFCGWIIFEIVVGVALQGGLDPVRDSKSRKKCGSRDATHRC